MSSDELFGNQDAFGGLLSDALGKVQAAQARAAEARVVGEAGGGLVKVTANGHQQILRVEIDPSVIDPKDAGMLEDLVVAATNSAIQKARESFEEELGPLKQIIEAGGIKL
jgi:DNA-binding YbaB/EbfC family protein